MSTISPADASLLAILLDQVYPTKLDFPNATTRMQAIDPSLSENAVRLRVIRFLKKFRSEGFEIGEAIKTAEKEKGKPKGSKNGVTKTTPKKPRGKAVLKGGEAVDGKFEEFKEEIKDEGI